MSDELTIKFSIKHMDYFRIMMTKLKFIIALWLVGSVVLVFFLNSLNVGIYTSNVTIYVYAKSNEKMTKDDLEMGAEVTKDFASIVTMNPTIDATIARLKSEYDISISRSQLKSMLEISYQDRLMNIKCSSVDGFLSYIVALVYSEQIDSLMPSLVTSANPIIVEVAEPIITPVYPDNRLEITLGSALIFLCLLGAFSLMAFHESETSLFSLELS